VHSNNISGSNISSSFAGVNVNNVNMKNQQPPVASRERQRTAALNLHNLHSFNSSGNGSGHTKSHTQAEDALVGAVAYALRLMDSSGGKKKIMGSQRSSVYIRKFAYK
jgi:hypothetical protein